MKESGKTKIIGGNTAAVLLVVAAFLCLPLSRSTDIAFFDKLLHFIRRFIYIGLFAAWGVSIYKRVMQPAVRKYLTYVSGLIVMWLVIRDFKWRFVTDPDVCASGFHASGKNFRIPASFKDEPVVCPDTGPDSGGVDQ